MKRRRLFIVLSIIFLVAVVTAGWIFYERRNESVVSNLSDKIGSFQSKSEPEYHFSCSETSRYADSWCVGKSSTTIISTTDYSDDSEASYNNRRDIEDTAKLIAADKNLNKEYQELLKAIAIDIKEYDSQANSLQDARANLIESEKIWVSRRDKDCELIGLFQDPSTVGADGGGAYDPTECVVASMANRTDLIRKILSELNSRAVK